MKIRHVVVAFAGAAVMTVTGVAAATAVSPAPAHVAQVKVAAQPTPAACNWRQLSVGLHGYQMKDNYRGFLVTVTNTSDRSCTLNGYVSLQLQGSWHQPLWTRTVHGNTLFATDPGAAPLVLSPGETVSADIGFYTWPLLPGWRHGTQPIAWPWERAVYLQVTVPGSQHAFTLTIPRGPSMVQSGRMYVTALARHTDYASGYPVMPW